MRGPGLTLELGGGGGRSRATGAAGYCIVADLPALRNEKAIAIVPLARTGRRDSAPLKLASVALSSGKPLWRLASELRDLYFAAGRADAARQQSWAANVRFGSKADIEAPPSDVRFTPKSGQGSARPWCPLCARSGHCRFQRPGERLAMMLTTLNVITTSLASLVGNQSVQMRDHPLAEQTGTPRSGAYSNPATSRTRRSGFVIGAKRARTTPALSTS